MTRWSRKAIGEALRSAPADTEADSPLAGADRVVQFALGSGAVRTVRAGPLYGHCDGAGSARRGPPLAKGSPANLPLACGLCLTGVNTGASIRWMSRPRHPNKHVEKAVQYAEAVGWHVHISNGHAWGKLFCPRSTREGCIVSVWSTPRNPENHARHLRREIDLCPHRPQAETADQEEGQGDGT
jgi:hypothetical protein